MVTNMGEHATRLLLIMRRVVDSGSTYGPKNMYKMIAVGR